MTQINIAGKEYQLKYTIESWKKLKEAHGITPTNFQEKLDQDFANVFSAVVFYGLLPSERASLTVDTIDQSLGFESADIVMQAILENMPKQSSERDDGVGKK